MAPKINQIKTDESMNNGNVVNESINNVSSKGESKLKKSVNNAIAKMAIVLSLTGTAAPEVATSTIVPEAVATITTMTPATGAALKAIAIGTSGALLTACEKPDDIGPKIIKEVKEITISGGETLTITGNQVKVGNTVVQEFWDDVSANNVTISSNFDGSTISSGKPIDKSGRVTSISEDQAGNQSRTAKTHITKKETAEKPKCSLHIPEITISEGDTVTQKGKDIIAGTQKIFAWESDDYTFSTNVKLPYTVSNEIDITFSLSIKGGQPETRTTKIKVSEDNNQAPEVTREYPQDKVPNILGGVTVKGENNQLKFGDVVMYTGKDDNTETCTISLKLKGSNEEKIGKKITESGTYVLTYTDKDKKSSSPIEFPVKSESIDLTSPGNLNMQVNQEVDLLEGIKTPSGIEITKVEVEINGQRQEVKAKNGHYLYTPDQAGTCYIYVTEKGEFGNTYVDKSKDPLTIKGPEYIAPTLETADIINDQYPRFNNMTQRYKEHGYDPSVRNNKRNFVYPHVLISYYTGDRCRLDNLEYIMVGEVPTNYPCENVGPEGFIDHANSGYKHIKDMTPFATIKACGGDWRDALKYVSAHPEKNFMLSCAADGLGAGTAEELQKLESYKALKKLLEMENVVASVASLNKNSTWKVINENSEINKDTETETGCLHTSASVNSGKNNKYTIVGYNPAKDNVFLDDNQSRLPIDFPGIGKGNLIVPFVSLVGNDDSNLITSTSSDPTGAESSTLGDHLSVIMYNHPNTTLEDASTIMQSKYFLPETFKYKDTDGTVKKGGTRYLFNSDIFINEELLHKSEIEAVQLSGDIVELPSWPGACYVGPGFQFEYRGQKYDNTKENQSKLMDIIANNDIKWYRSKKSCIEHGGNGNTVDLDVYILNKHGKKLPDVHLHITKTIK